MPLVKKSFTMSMFASERELFAKKAEYYLEQAEKVQMELAVSLETTAHLERVTLELSRKLEAANRLLDMRDRDMS